MCFRLALLHSTAFIFFLYHLPSSSSCSVVEAVSSNIILWNAGDRWLVTFNVTKTKLLYFNRHRDPLWHHCGDVIELPEEISFRLFGLTFTPSMDWKPYIQSIVKAASRKMCSLYWVQHFLTLESIWYLYKSTILPCMECCSHIWGGAPRSHGLDLVDSVQKHVVSLVCFEKPSHTVCC